MISELVISFPDPSASFVHGVEYGRLLQMMEQGDPEVKNHGFPVHIGNREVIEATCKRFGYNAMFSECFVEGWVYFKAVKGLN